MDVIETCASSPEVNAAYGRTSGEFRVFHTCCCISYAYSPPAGGGCGFHIERFENILEKSTLLDRNLEVRLAIETQKDGFGRCPGQKLANAVDVRQGGPRKPRPAAWTPAGTPGWVRATAGALTSIPATSSRISLIWALDAADGCSALVDQNTPRCMGRATSGRQQPR